MKNIERNDMDAGKIDALFEAVQMFAYLNESEKEDILSIADVLHFSDGENIITEGEISPYLFAVISGDVSVQKKVGTNSEEISVIKRGDVFGEAGIFINMERTASNIAVGDVFVLRLERKDLFRFFKKHADAGVKMLMIMTYSLLNKLKDRHAMELGTDSAVQITQSEIDQVFSSNK